MSRTTPLVLVLAASVLGSCAGSSASYTRFRARAAEGRGVAAEEVRASEMINYLAQADAPRPPMTAPGAASGLAIVAELGNPVLPAARRSHPVLQVALRGTASVVRPPATIVLAVDLSGSMNEDDKIGAVRHAVSRLVEALDPEDRIALVTFSSQVSAAGPWRVSESRAAILEAVGRFRAGGGTNIHGALETALGIARSSRLPGATTRVVLLSDGMPTAGITSRHVILGLARQADAHGLSVTTVGLGDQIDDALLSGIARVSGGQYRYVDRPSEVERVFAAELRGLTEPAAREVAVTVHLPRGWTLHRSFDEAAVPLPTVGFASRVGEVSGDEAVVLLYELEAPAVPVGTTEQIVVDLSFASPASPERRAVARGVVQVARAEVPVYDGAPGGAVLRNYTVGLLAHALRESDLLRRAGASAAAALSLRGSAAQLSTTRARLAGAGEAGLAASLAEPESLVLRVLDGLESEARIGSAREVAPVGWSDWGRRVPAHGSPGGATFGH